MLFRSESHNLQWWDIDFEATVDWTDVNRNLQWWEEMDEADKVCFGMNDERLEELQREYAFELYRKRLREEPEVMHREEHDKYMRFCKRLEEEREKGEKELERYREEKELERWGGTVTPPAGVCSPGPQTPEKQDALAIK